MSTFVYRYFQSSMVKTRSFFFVFYSLWKRIYFGKIHFYYLDDFYLFLFRILIVFLFKHFYFKGEQLGPTEATETFFAMTKLFQSKDVSLFKELIVNEMIEQ